VIAPAKPAAIRSSARGEARTGRSRLAFGEERELSALPARIEALEARVEEIRRRFADPSLYRDAAQEAKALHAELAQVERDLADAYARWEVLEGRKDAAGDVDD
jgi:ATP-binding cassette subfamily F protein uup